MSKTNKKKEQVKSEMKKLISKLKKVQEINEESMMDLVHKLLVVSNKHFDLRGGKFKKSKKLKKKKQKGGVCRDEDEDGDKMDAMSFEKLDQYPATDIVKFRMKDQRQNDEFTNRVEQCYHWESWKNYLNMRIDHTAPGNIKLPDGADINPNDYDTALEVLRNHEVNVTRFQRGQLRRPRRLGRQVRNVLINPIGRLILNDLGRLINNIQANLLPYIFFLIIGVIFATYSEYQANNYMHENHPVVATVNDILEIMNNLLDILGNL